MILTFTHVLNRRRWRISILIVLTVPRQHISYRLHWNSLFSNSICGRQNSFFLLSQSIPGQISNNRYSCIFYLSFLEATTLLVYSICDACLVLLALLLLPRMMFVHFCAATIQYSRDSCHIQQKSFVGVLIYLFGWASHEDAAPQG